MRRHLFWTTLAAAIAVGFVFVAAATAAPATTSTMHFSSIVDLGAPTGPTTNISGCPAPVIDDFTSIDATGNGISHQTVNGAGDFWSTSTFAGTATVTFYPMGTFDSMGNVIGVSGQPDMQVTGRLTEWFGTSANHQNAVFHGTVNFRGVTVFPNPGMPISFHDVVHGAYLPGADQNGPPSFFFNVASC